MRHQQRRIKRHIDSGSLRPYEAIAFARFTQPIGLSERGAGRHLDREHLIVLLARSDDPRLRRWTRRARGPAASTAPPAASTSTSLGTSLRASSLCPARSGARSASPSASAASASRTVLCLSRARRDKPGWRQVKVHGRSGIGVGSTVDDADGDVEFLSWNNGLVLCQNVENQAGCESQRFLKVGLLPFEQEPDMLVCRTSADLLELFQGCRQVRNKVRWFADAGLLPDCVDLLFELVEIPTEGRFQLREVGQFVQNTCEEIGAIGNIHALLNQLETGIARSTILNGPLPLRAVEAPAFRCNLRVRPSEREVKLSGIHRNSDGRRRSARLSLRIGLPAASGTEIELFCLPGPAVFGKTRMGPPRP